MMKMSCRMKFLEIMFRIRQSIILVGLLVFSFASFGQFEVPKKPSFQTSLYDYAKLLSASDATALETKLVNYYDSTGTQIVVAIIETLDGADIGILTPEWGHEWGVGGKEDNGVFILLAKKEKKIYIAPGYGLEHLLTAGINGEIIRNHIIPKFKNNDYYGGLDAGTDQLMHLFSGTYKKTKTEGGGTSGLTFFLLFVGFFILLIILVKRNKKGGGGNGGSSGNRSNFSWMDAIILSQTISSAGSRSHGRGGFGGGSGGGFGGFGGGFGGGGFSGGGAGGSW